MKKTALVVFLVLCMALTVLLSSCFDEESYYTKTDTESLLKTLEAALTEKVNANTANEARIAALEQQVAELLNLLNQPTYTVTFDLAGGEGSISSQSVKDGKKVTKPADPTRAGYTFRGWFAGDEEWAFKGHVVTESMTLTARWEANTYAVRYYWDNELVFIDEATYGSAYTLYYYYGVAKWSCSNGTYAPKTEIEWTHVGDLELYAQKAYAGTDFLLSTSGTTATITDYQGNDTEVVIPDYVIQGGVIYQITAIGSSAFYNCSSLTSINIPASVTEIGERAFEDCSNLTNVTFDEGSRLTKVHMYAFRNCNSLVGVYITDLAVWCQTTFSNATANPLYYGATLYLNDNELIGNIVIPTGVIKISTCAFYNYDKITSITIPSSVLLIANAAFYGCSSLTSINIPVSVISIGHYAFSRCSSLTSVTFENTTGWWCASFSTATSGTAISATGLEDTSTAATYLTSAYNDYYWKRG